MRIKAQSIFILPIVSHRSTNTKYAHIYLVAFEVRWGASDAKTVQLHESFLEYK